MHTNSDTNEKNSSAQNGVMNKYLQGNQYVYHYNRQLDQLNTQNQLLEHLIQANECMDKTVQKICRNFIYLENKLAKISCEQKKDQENIVKELEELDTRLASKLAEQEKTHFDIHRVVKDLSIISQNHINEMNQYNSSILDLSNQFHSFDIKRQQIENKHHEYDKKIESVFVALDELKESQENLAHLNNQKIDHIVEEIKDEVMEKFDNHESKHQHLETKHRDYEDIIEEVLIAISNLEVIQQNQQMLNNQKFDDIGDNLKDEATKRDNAIHSILQQLQYLKDFETSINSYMNETSNHIEKIEIQLMKMDEKSHPLCSILEKLPANYPVNTIYINGDFISVSHFISVDCKENLAIFSIDNMLINIDCSKIDGIRFISHL
ncbi:hypothetical protein JOC75_001003 [Metabacillus crassostreae]|uniref:hypothetical protein n=1 Tax=Metabacillus crassostreae TaxID=929098 RepID=UPI00195CB5AB|nr:hypothetical protein [Metabacillus crassostreae]MBM7603033.1 hypothetical protein [Metabacillus crassostreae]